MAQIIHMTDEQVADVLASYLTSKQIKRCIDEADDKTPLSTVEILKVALKRRDWLDDIPF